MTNISELQRLQEEGKFVFSQGKGTEIGYIIDGVDADGSQITRSVYEPKGDNLDGIFRVGNPANRDYDAIRSELSR